MRAHTTSQTRRTVSGRLSARPPLIAIGLLALSLAAPATAETGGHDSSRLHRDAIPLNGGFPAAQTDAPVLIPLSYDVDLDADARNDRLIAAPAIHRRQEVVYVDQAVGDYQVLLAGIGAHVDVVRLDGRRDGIEQIAGELTRRGPVAAVHVIAHGGEAELRLGSGVLSRSSMRAEHADALAAIRRSLTEGADILIYGCSFGRGASGREATALLARLTGADVAASDDPTGAEGRGGDWDLEVATGSIETDVVVTAEGRARWRGLLVAPTVTARETIDSDADGQIDHIKITTDQPLNDNFGDLTMTVSGYTVTGYVTEIGAGGVNDNVFYVQLTESGSPDTGVRPTVLVTANTLLTDFGGSNALLPIRLQTARSRSDTNRDGNYEIYVMDADGSNPTRLTNDAAVD